MILGFHTKQLRERGTEIAIFDYALGAQTVLGHESRIFVPAASHRIVESVKDHFSRAFEVVLYDDPDSISCDALYVIKKGTYSRVTTGLPELNHAFSDGSHPHGHRFAVVSEWLARTTARRLSFPWGRTMTIPGLRRPPACATHCLSSRDRRGSPSRARYPRGSGGLRTPWRRLDV